MGNLTFTIKPNIGQIGDARRILDEKQYRVAMQAAISRTLTTGVAHAARTVGKSLNMKIGDIKKTFTVKRPGFDNLKGSILINSEPVKLAYYRTTQTAKGVRVNPWKGGTAQVLRSTFKATMRSGHVGVFERKLTAGPRSPRVARLPIQERYGPSVITAVAGNKRRVGVGDDIAVDLSKTLDKNIDSQIQRILFNKGSIAKFRPFLES